MFSAETRLTSIYGGILDNVTFYMCMLACIKGNLVEWFVRSETNMYTTMWKNEIANSDPKRKNDKMRALLKAFYEQEGYFLTEYNDPNNKAT